MKLADVLKVLLEAKEKHGDQIECVAYTLGHGPFEIGCILVEEDEDYNLTHIQFGPEPDVPCPKVTKDDEDFEEEDEK